MPMVKVFLPKTFCQSDRKKENVLWVFPKRKREPIRQYAYEKLFLRIRFVLLYL